MKLQFYSPTCEPWQVDTRAGSRSSGCNSVSFVRCCSHCLRLLLCVAIYLRTLAGCVRPDRRLPLGVAILRPRLESWQGTRERDRRWTGDVEKAAPNRWGPSGTSSTTMPRPMHQTFPANHSIVKDRQEVHPKRSRASISLGPTRRCNAISLDPSLGRARQLECQARCRSPVRAHHC